MRRQGNLRLEEKPKWNFCGLIEGNYVDFHVKSAFTLKFSYTLTNLAKC